MTTAELEQLAEAYAHDELEPEQRVRLADRLAADPAQLAIFARGVREVVALHGACGGAPARTARQVVHRLASGTESGRRRTGRRIVRRLRVRARGPARWPLLAAGLAGLAALVALVVAAPTADGPVVRIGTVAVDGRGHGPGERLPWGREARSVAGAEVELGDGTRIVLRPGAVARLDAEDHVALAAGDAELRVRPRPERPLRLSLPRCTATVLGTAFTAAAGGASDRIAVASGRVRVDHRDGASLVLAAGESALADARGLQREGAIATTAAAPPDGPLVDLLARGTVRAVGAPEAIDDDDGPGGRSLALPTRGSGIELALPATPAARTLHVTWRDDDEAVLAFRVLVDGVERTVVRGSGTGKAWRATVVDLPPGTRAVRIESLDDARPAQDARPRRPYATTVRLGTIAVRSAADPRP